MVGQRAVNPWLRQVGSIPTSRTSFIRCSASGMSLGLGPRFRKFDSSTTDHQFIRRSKMKRKKIATPKRNPYVKLALFRKAGSHRKSNKALRKNIKQSGYDEIGYHSRLLIYLSEFESRCLDHVILKHT